MALDSPRTAAESPQLQGSDERTAAQAGSPTVEPRKPSDRIDERSRRVAEPKLQYLGFDCTEEGREYCLRIGSSFESREVVVLITHETLASGLLSFQDAPSFCFAKVKRALAADPELKPTEALVLTTGELADHRISAAANAAAGRKNRSGRTG